MNRFQKLISSKVTTAVLFVLAAALLLFSGFGGARAALTYYSETYTSEVQMYDIGVSLVENGKIVSYRDYSGRGDGSWSTGTGELLTDLDDSFKPGVTYPETIAVTNSGTINEYVRVSIYTYWRDKDGNKLQTLSPDLIELQYSDNGAWQEDTGAATKERRVFYYTSLLNSGDTTPNLTDTITVNGMIASKVTQVQEGNTITTTYDYDGVTFCLEAEVDAVQEHNAHDAAFSAWGKDLSIGGGSLSLGN